MIKNLI